MLRSEHSIQNAGIKICTTGLVAEFEQPDDTLVHRIVCRYRMPTTGAKLDISLVDNMIQTLCNGGVGGKTWVGSWGYFGTVCVQAEEECFPPVFVPSELFELGKEP